MAIPTTRFVTPGEIQVNAELCTGCGSCVEECPDQCIILASGKAVPGTESKFGCIACGHCMAVCTTGAITISGRGIAASDMFMLPAGDKIAGLPQLEALMDKRRSIRKFKDKEVEPELVQQILRAASTAPMGIPPSDVYVTVFDSRKMVRDFTEDFVKYLDNMKWFFSPFFLALMRPVWGKTMGEMFKLFLKPLYHSYSSNMKKGVNLVTYDAPVALYFYGSPYSDQADPAIAATYAMLAAESLGLGTCMLGAIHPFIQSGGSARKFREKRGIRYKSKSGLFVILGYPVTKYKKGIHRSFASVDFAK